MSKTGSKIQPTRRRRSNRTTITLVLALSVLAGVAARRGVRQHHWRLGNMPARPKMSNSQMAAIIRYVRELQRANGITYRKHVM